MIKIIFLVLIFVFFAQLLVSAETITIEGLDVPIIDGALKEHSAGAQQIHAEIATYAVDKPLDEVIGYYESYLSSNNFIILGGRESGSFNASVKKGTAMFTLRIYGKASQTKVQFVW